MSRHKLSVVQDAASGCLSSDVPVLLGAGVSREVRGPLRAGQTIRPLVIPRGEVGISAAETTWVRGVGVAAGSRRETVS